MQIAKFDAASFKWPCLVRPRRGGLGSIFILFDSLGIFSVYQKRVFEAGQGHEMKIIMVGAGYVGLVSGVCFSDFGHDVVCVDKDLDKIARLNRGEAYFRAWAGSFDGKKHPGGAAVFHRGRTKCNRWR